MKNWKIWASEHCLYMQADQTIPDLGRVTDDALVRQGKDKGLHGRSTV